MQLLNQTIPQTLPSKVLQSFNALLLQQVLQSYDQLISQSLSLHSQNIALQLYFDLNFIQSAFSISREQSALHEQLLKLQNQLKAEIDPFDFELFAEHLLENVQKSCQRLSCLMAVLTAKLPQIPVSMQTQPVSAAQAKDPNILCLSTSAANSVWFPLLPIVSTTAAATASASSYSESFNKSTKTYATDADKVNYVVNGNINTFVLPNV